MYSLSNKHRQVWSLHTNLISEIDLMYSLIEYIYICNLCKHQHLIYPLDVSLKFCQQQTCSDNLKQHDKQATGGIT